MSNLKIDEYSVEGIGAIPSASTIDLENATGDLLEISGTTTITAIQLFSGHERTVRFADVLTLTHGTTLVLPGAANITTAAGDFAVFRGYLDGKVRCVVYTSAASSGAGNVVGPASATANVPVLFNGTTGKIIKNSTPTGTGNPVMQDAPTVTAPVLGVATGTSLAVSGLITTSSPTAAFGFVTGAGGAQTQLTSKSTTVVSNTNTTAITMHGAEILDDTTVSFTFTNSAISATDTVLCTHQSAGTSGSYVCNVFPGAGSAVVSVRNVTTGGLSEAIVLRITVIKSVSA